MTPMPMLKCPQCARELPAGAQACPWDGTPINSVVARPSLWEDNTVTKTKDVGRTAETDEQNVIPALLPGQKLGDYEVRQLLGSGGMGEVYAGEQPMIGKKVAIKVLKAEIAAEPGNVQRMLSEARSVNAIRHRSIVDIFNFGTLPDGRPYLVMEYLDGTALDTMLRKQGALVPHEVAEFLEEICSALAAAHGQGIVHRDLKPGNVFIVSDGNTRNRYVKLLDFGLAKGEASGEASKQTRAGMVVGTPDYIAPEQARGGKITARTDLYSLGVMAFEMITGALPFAADSVVELMMMHVQAPAPRVSSKIDFCPPALDALIYQLMAKAPEDRPRSAESVRQELSRIRREMREGETLIGIVAGVPNKETIRIAVPEADTPSELAVPEQAPPQPPMRPRASSGRPNVPAPELPTKPREEPTRKQGVVDPTARYQVVIPRERGSKRVWLALGAAVLLLAAAGIWIFTQGSDQPIELMPPPPDRVPIGEMVVTPDPVKPVKVVPVTEPEADPNPNPVKPVATPVKPVTPPRPPKPPPPKPVVVRDQGPTVRELQVELKKLIAHREKFTSPGLLKALEESLNDKIIKAKNGEERQKVLNDMKNVP